jgi:hypothetical protein
VNNLRFIKPLHPLCLNRKGEIVLRGSVWKQKAWIVLSVCGYTGIKSKRTFLLARSDHHDYNHDHATILENMAHLWAMQYGVGEFEFTRRNADHRELFHPSEWDPTSIPKENQP